MNTRVYGAEIRAAMSASYAAWREVAAIKATPSTEGWSLAEMKAQELTKAERALRDEAAKAFATLNGWRRSKSEFGVETLARGGVYGHGRFFGGVFDHPVFFREFKQPFRAAAIVGQPYGDVTAEDGLAVAESCGLELHMPPNLGASWHNPGENGTQFFVFSRPGMQVRFLPEQLTVTGDPLERHDILDPMEKFRRVAAGWPIEP